MLELTMKKVVCVKIKLQFANPSKATECIYFRQSLNGCN